MSQPFIPVTSPVEGDFFSIVTLDGGERIIHVNGYMYHSDDHWALIEVCWFLKPLETFIRGLADNPDYADMCYEEVSQYQTDFESEEEAVKAVNGHFNGNPPKEYLSFGKITMDTPDGNYISC